MKLVFSFDDGNIMDLTHTAPLLDKYGYRAIFYIPTFFKGEPGMPAEGIKALRNKGHQIGGHTQTHPQDLKAVPTGNVYGEIAKNKEYLEGIVEHKVVSFCYPRGRYNEFVIEEVKRAGYDEARTTIVGMTKYEFNPFKAPTTLHLANRDEYHGKSVVEMFKTYLTRAEMYKDAGYMHIWGHSEEINRLGLWSEFEEILKILREKNYEDVYTKQLKQIG